MESKAEGRAGTGGVRARFSKRRKYRLAGRGKLIYNKKKDRRNSRGGDGVELSGTHLFFLLLTVGLVIGVGLYAARQVKSAEGYSLGGRSAGAKRREKL